MKISKTHFFNFKETSIAYQIYGRGPAVVFLHGYCEDSFIWQSGIKRWSKTHTCITIDLPGFGKSSLGENYTITDLGDMVAQLLGLLSIAKCTIIGHSMGGYAALAFAAEYPTLLSGVGLIHSHCFEDSEQKKANRKKSIDFINRHGAAGVPDALLHPAFCARKLR
jgi:pimeloyl-ACP methyl ester carboxylesterase